MSGIIPMSKLTPDQQELQRTYRWNRRKNKYYRKPEIKKGERTPISSCRRTIKKHHEDMKNDPERLTTEFLINIIHCKCKNGAVI